MTKASVSPSVQPPGLTSLQLYETWKADVQRGELGGHTWAAGEIGMIAQQDQEPALFLFFNHSAVSM